MNYLHAILLTLKESMSQDISVVVDQLLSVINQDSDLFASLKILEIEYNIFKVDKIKGILSHDDAGRKTNDIISRLINLIDSIKQDDLNVNSELFINIEKQIKNFKLNPNFEHLNIDEFISSFTEYWHEWENKLNNLFADTNEVFERFGTIFDSIKGITGHQVPESLDIDKHEYTKYSLDLFFRRSLLFMNEMNNFLPKVVEYISEYNRVCEVYINYLVFPLKDEEKIKFKDLKMRYSDAFCTNFKYIEQLKANTLGMEELKVEMREIFNPQQNEEKELEHLLENFEEEIVQLQDEFDAIFDSMISFGKQLSFISPEIDKNTKILKLLNLQVFGT